MKAHSDELKDVIYQVGMKFKDSLNQRAFGLVTLDENLEDTAFYIAPTDKERTELIRNLRALADGLEKG